MGFKVKAIHIATCNTLTTNVKIKQHIKIPKCIITVIPVQYWKSGIIIVFDVIHLKVSVPILNKLYLILK